MTILIKKGEPDWPAPLDLQLKLYSNGHYLRRIIFFVRAASGVMSL